MRRPLLLLALFPCLAAAAPTNASLQDAYLRAARAFEAIPAVGADMRRDYVASAGTYTARLNDQGILALQGTSHTARVWLESLNGVRIAAPSATILGKDDAGWSRLSYQRPGLAERFDSRAKGVEHSFVIDRRPQGSLGTLRIGLRATGLQPKSADNRVALMDGAKEIFSYSGIRAWDADGKPLPARLDATGSNIELQVDDLAARYPVTVDPLWTQTARLQGTDTGANDDFGFSVAIDNETAVVGAPGSLSPGSAYVFTRSGGVWTQEAKLTPSVTDDRDFGYSVDVDGDTVIVGASATIFGGTAGAAFVFTRSGTTWTEQARLVSTTRVNGDNFGISVAVDGDTAIVGASGHDVKTSNAGAAFVYTRTGTTWSPQATLTGSDTSFNHNFGSAVALEGDRAIIGAPRGTTNGAAYVFTRSGTVWSEDAKLNASDAGSNSLARFGNAVALDGDTAVVGAFGIDRNTGNDVGGAYIYVRSSGVWTEQANLVPPDHTGGERFGISVAIDGDTALIGGDAGYLTNHGLGAAYVYTRSGTTWSNSAKLVAIPTTFEFEDGFGISVALQGSTALVGGYVSGNTGAVFEFKLVGTSLHAGFDVPWRTGGKPVNLTLTLLSGTFATDSLIKLSSDTSSLTVPATATIPAGMTSVTVPCTTAVVATDVTANVTASYNGTKTLTSVDVRSPRVGRLDLAAPTVAPGQSVALTVVLNGAAPAGGLVVYFNATPNGALSFPSTVTVPAGQTRAVVNLTNSSVPTDTVVTIGADPAYEPKTATLTAVGPDVATLSTGGVSSVEVGDSVQVRMTMGMAKGVNRVVPMVYSGPATGPTTVTVPATKTMQPFYLDAGTSAGTATVTAQYGLAHPTVSVKVVKPVLLSLTLGQSLVDIGRGTYAIVTLEKPAPDGGVLLSLSLDKPRATIPATVTVAPGQTTAAFAVTDVTGLVTVRAKTRTGGLKGALLGVY